MAAVREHLITGIVFTGHWEVQIPKSKIDNNSAKISWLS